MIFYKLVWLFIAMLFLGCSSILTRPVLDPSINYQRDIKFKVQYLIGDKWSKEHTIIGMGVMPESSKYKITVYPPGLADMLTVTSCHREEKTANPDKSWFSSGYTFELDLVGGLESQRTCPIDIGVYEKKAGRHGWASMAILTKRETLPALMKCNGKVKQYGGVSACQAKTGLIQKYEFKIPVAIATIPGCDIGQAKDEMNWEFLMPAGSCTVYFIDKKNPNNFHQANMFGYDVLPIRGVQ